MIVFPDCVTCIHLDRKRKGNLFCKAFPDGGPKEIDLGDVKHRAPYPGDHGIQYEPDPDPFRDLPTDPEPGSILLGT
jgi:hypothetical protein